MRKLTAIIALTITLSVAAPVATLAAPAPHKPKTTSVREDQGPADKDVISRVIQIISKYLHIGSHEQPITPTP